MSAMEKIIQSMGRKLGLEIRWHTIYSSESFNLYRLLVYNQIDTVLDIGANIGQYSMDLIANGFRGRIISFEPLAEAYRKLKANNLGSKGNWSVGNRMAFGNSDEEIEMNVSGNLTSSSILPMMDAHSRAAPDSAYVHKERVPMRRLDSIAGELNLGKNLFIKIDVQGFEMEVLKGAAHTIENARGLQIEMSLVELYEGQGLMMEMINYLTSLNFELHALFPVFKDESTGRLLQVDGVFIKR